MEYSVKRSAGENCGSGKSDSVALGDPLRRPRAGVSHGLPFPDWHRNFFFCTIPAKRRPQMKTRKSSMVALAILLACGLIHAAPALHSFELWGKRTDTEKLYLYLGWSNGFLAARGPRGMELANCLESITYDQAIAMIDKRYKDHPELWSHPLGEQILDALTVDGGPCQGKNPLPSTP
jgi:hypothetical protein